MRFWVRSSLRPWRREIRGRALISNFTPEIAKVSLFSQSLLALPLDEAIATTADIGYPAIELACCAPHFDPATACASAETVVKKVERAGLSVSALSLFNSFTVEETLESEIASAENFIRLAPLFQTSVLKLTPGGPGSAQAELAHWQCLARAVERLTAAADETGVRLAFETHMRQLTDTLASSRRLMAMALQPAIGLTVDFCNLAFAGEEMMEVVAALGCRTVNTHVKNGYVDPHGGWHFQALDQGIINYPAVLRLLRNTGYDGYLTIECLSPETIERPAERARADLEILMRWLTEMACEEA